MFQHEIDWVGGSIRAIASKTKRMRVSCMSTQTLYTLMDLDFKQYMAKGPFSKPLKQDLYCWVLFLRKQNKTKNGHE